MTSFRHDMAAYETWLRKRCDVVEKDLEEKHDRMRKSDFKFLRATYFRWARTIEEICPDLASAPRVACVGDIHVENFGTWRDADARLVWGINDFDEAAVMPYAYDLVRLVTSVLLAPGHPFTAARAATAVLDGYRSGLSNPIPALLDENAGWLRSFADPSEEESRQFWNDVDALPEADPPAPVRKGFRKSLPVGATDLRFASRTAGGGSLGRPRFVAVASWNCGRVVREAKAFVPSAWGWAHDGASRQSWFVDLADGSFRSPDPLLHIEGGFVFRRIAPDARKIDFKGVHAHKLSTRLLEAMGADLAAVHASDPRSTRIAGDLEAREPAWLARAAEAARLATQRDFETYASRADLTF
jgi:Uncharacterized protein conserved in bacteria (DUF2252)